MKKLSFAVIAASLAFIPAGLTAQEFDVPQNPPVILSPETVVVDPVAEPAAEEPVVETKKAKKEKKVKEPKVKEVKEPKAKKEKKGKTYGFCNHVGIGVGAGIMDGLSATVGVPLGNHFQIRGNYSVGVPDQVYPLQYEVPDLGTYSISGKDVHLTDILVKGELTRNLNAMLDIYLSKNSGFHLTVGLSGILDPKILSVSADISKPLSEAFPGQDPSSLFIELNDDAATDPAKKQIRISTDKAGVLHLDMRDRQEQFRPYFGIGWGRVASIKSWLNLNLDLGVQKTNGFEFVGYNYDGQPQVFTSGLIDHKDKIGSFEDLLDKAAAGDLPYIKGFMPVIRLGLTIRLF
jgi:hypothetical protein